MNTQDRSTDFHRMRFSTPTDTLTLVKIGMCVGLIALLAWVVVTRSTHPGDTPAVPVSDSAPVAANFDARNVTYSKQVFDQRRARFEAKHARLADGDVDVARAEIAAP